MKTACSALLLLLCCVGCRPTETSGNKEQRITNTELSDSEACDVLLRDLKIPADSELGKALATRKYDRDADSGLCIIETQFQQFAFNVKEKSFRIVRGIELKTGAPQVVRGEFYVTASGEWKARFGKMAQALRALTDSRVCVCRPSGAKAKHGTQPLTRLGSPVHQTTPRSAARSPRW